MAFSKENIIWVAYKELKLNREFIMKMVSIKVRRFSLGNGKYSIWYIFAFSLVFD